MIHSQYLTEQQAMDDFSLIIIRNILNGTNTTTIVDELETSKIPRETAQKLVNLIATQIIAAKSK